MMRRFIFSIILFLQFIQPVMSDGDLLFGSVAMDIPAEMHKRLTPLTNYLSNELGREVKLHLSPDMKGAINQVSRGSVNLAYLTPVAYIKSKQKGNTRLLVKTETKGKGAFQLMIVAKDDGKINSVADLKGKSFAFGDRAALLQRAVVVGSGVELEDFSSYKFLGHYENIARGVYSGDFDAGILKDTKAFAWEKKGLKIIYQSAMLPPYNIAVTESMDDVTYKNLQKAFLKLSKNDNRHKQVIQALNKNYTGFLEVSDAEYDIVRKLIKRFD